MNKTSIDSARDVDLRLSQQALRRAAQRAREVARETGTGIVVSHHGIVETIRPQPAAPNVQEPPASYGKAP